MRPLFPDHRRLLATAALALASTLFAACATAPLPIAPPATLLAGDRFQPPDEPVDAMQALQVSDAMRRYLAHDISELLRQKGPQGGLVEALYRRGLLRLEYDAEHTRNAAEAFEARSGNCLSLLLMTAALARELGLQVRFQSADLDASWSRSGQLLFASGHVNVTLGTRLADKGSRFDTRDLTVDFLPADELSRLRTRDIAESTVLAMYANNRAAEALARHQLDAAYAWATEALRIDPAYPGGYNTLGVIYLNHGDLDLAAAVFQRILARDPEHPLALSNLAETLRRTGQAAESQALLERLARVEREPPFHWFDIGLAAARADDWATARRCFERALGRTGNYHEVLFWLGMADFRLGNAAAAQRHLQRAMENSVTRDQHALYAAKLAWLREHASRGS